MKRPIAIGREILYVEYEECNFKEVYFKHIDEIDPKYFIRYDKEKNLAIVNNTAPQWYKELAALHENICCGHKYEDMVSGINDVKPEERCARIERFVIQNAGANKQSYILARISMFKILLDNNLCDESFRPSIKNTLDLLMLSL